MTLPEITSLIEKGYKDYLVKFPHSTLTFDQYQELAVEAIELMQLHLQAETN